MSSQPTAQITVKLPDGSTRELTTGATGADLAASIGRRLAEAAVVVEVNGLQKDLAYQLQDGDTVSVVTADSDAGRYVLRHSTAHVLAQAVLDLWEGAEFAIGPPIENGFYYDFRLPGGATFVEADLAKIETRMREIMKEDQPFDREVVDVEAALGLFDKQTFKTEIINNHETVQGVEEGFVSLYRNTPSFVELCRGPHVPRTKRLGHFKLQKVAGAYWRGSEKNPMLQRIYGTAWESKKALDAYLTMLEEAEKRDHRKLGVELDLFSFPDELGSGLPVFHPKGGLLRKLMEDYSRKRHEEGGYSFVNTPHITKGNLFETSGHLDWYADGMFPAMTLDADENGENGQDYYVKPMNCPMHSLIFRSRQRSYRELPLRLFEFGSVYRYEKSGVLHGLTRVRGMTQDDSHLYVAQDQMKEELTTVLQFVLDLLQDYGLDDFYLELSTKPEVKSVGTDEEWETATETLREVAEASGLDLVLDEGGGAFYGPKISVQARDAIGRTWQMSTVQLDFQLPQRFNLEYTGADNQKHRPIMIHRALFGSIERFMGVLVEHYAGAFPLWLSPVQIALLPVNNAHEDYADEVIGELKDAGFRTEFFAANEPLGARIRKAKMEKIPYVLVVGDDDVANRTLGVNPRGGEVERGVGIQDFQQRIRIENETLRHGAGEPSTNAELAEKK